MRGDENNRMKKSIAGGWIKLWSKVTGADLISALFLAVTIPHTAQVLQGYEPGEWRWLAWSLAGAIDIGIAYGGFISADGRMDKQARRWATLLFVGLSLGSYRLNVEHYLQARADPWWSYGLGLLLPGGILVLAKIKSRVLALRVTNSLSPVSEHAHPEVNQFQPHPEAKVEDLPQSREVTRQELEAGVSKLEQPVVAKSSNLAISHLQDQLEPHRQGSDQEVNHDDLAPTLQGISQRQVSLQGSGRETSAGVAEEVSLALPLQEEAVPLQGTLEELPLALEESSAINSSNEEMLIAVSASSASGSRLTRTQTEAIRQKVLSGELSLAQAKEQGVPEGTIYSWKSRYGEQLKMS
jgi:hypothetical protein